MITEAIRARIISLRKQSRLTQEDLAQKIGMDLRNYKRLEGGQKKIIDPDLLELLQTLLACLCLSFCRSKSSASDAT